MFTVGSGIGWRFESEPEPGLGGRRIKLPRGKVLGGSSAINGQLDVRGHPGDYDEWAALGATGWSFADVLPYFRRSEHWKGGGDPALRGADGPLKTALGRCDNPLYAAFIEAGRDLGHPVSDDLNGARPDGFGPSQYTHTHAFPLRCSAAHAYLAPVRRRRNLSVVTLAPVTALTLTGSRCTALRFVRRGKAHEVRAVREVVLSAGAYNTPQILMLSGIGDPAALAAAGVTPRHELPEVGRNLQEHFGCFVQHACLTPITYFSLTHKWRAALELARLGLTGSGPLAVFPMNAQGFVRSSPTLNRPDFQFYMFPLALDLAGGNLYKPAFHGYGIHWAVLRPKSRGRVFLASADPAAPPAIRHDCMTDPQDRALNLAAFRIARELHARPAFDPFRGAEVSPCPAVRDEAAIMAYLAAHTDSHYHPVGTCRMGSDGAAVVDPALRVRGVDGLRVADASVMPRLVGGNTNAAAIMIGEKAADLILGNGAPAYAPAADMAYPQSPGLPANLAGVPGATVRKAV